MTLKQRNKTFLGIINLAILITLFLAGLWPFTFWQENKLEWLKDRNGIRFHEPGIIYSPEPLKVSAQNSLHNGEITIDIWLQPETEPAYSIAHILTFFDGTRSENLIIAQWKSELIIRSMNTNSPNRKKYKEIGVANALPKGKLRFITITSGKGGTSIYLDGSLAKVYPNYRLSVENQRTLGNLILGNSSIGKNLWKGNIKGLAIYNNFLKPAQVSHNYSTWQEAGSPLLSEDDGIIALYLFNDESGNLVHDCSHQQNELIIPATFTVLQKKILELPVADFKPSLSYFVDLAVNITGFIPFGIFFTLYLSQVKNSFNYRIYLFTVLMGMVISLTIEILQAYIPTRSSSSIDLITNTLGTTIGVVIFLLAMKIKQHHLHCCLHKSHNAI
jgi:VanZ family protein